MGVKTAGRLATRLRERAAKTLAARRGSPQVGRKPDDTDKAPVIVSHAISQAASPPPPPRTFIGKAAYPPPPQLGSFASHGYQAPNLRIRAPLRPRPAVKAPSTTSRRKPKKPRRERSSRPEWEGYSTVHELRSLLGLGTSRDQVAQDAVLVAIDCEWERQGLVDYVIEVGITTLRISDLAGVAPGDYLRDWTAKMNHRHIVIDVTRRPKERMRSSLFGRSMFLSPADAKTTTISILQACIANQPIPTYPTSIPIDYSVASDDGVPSQLMLVGQSVQGDLNALKGRPLFLDILAPTATIAEAPPTDVPTPGMSGVHFTKIFDTFSFTYEARRRGIPMPSARLGAVVRALGVDPAYWDDSAAGTVKGVHNASNDAAYSIMAALLYALKWKALQSEHVLQAVREQAVKQDHHQQPRLTEAERLTREQKRSRFRRPILGLRTELAMMLCLLGAGTGVAQVLEMFAW